MTEQTELMGYAATLEAIIFASDKPVRERELRQHIPDEQTMAEIIEVIQQRFDASCGIELRQVGDGWAFRTRAEIAERLNKHKKIERPLSRAALEVLAIIAYHQPITRAEIEEIRGVAFGTNTLEILMELDWVKPSGRKDVPGKPIQYVTTDNFLSHFSLKKLSDLPTVDELGSAGLIDSTSIDSSIFGTGKFYKEKQDEKKENIYSNIDEMLSSTLKNEDK